MTNFNQKINIGNRIISQASPTYIIAEIGSNHDQSLDKAIEMIDAAADCGADAAKFQSLNFNALYKTDKTKADIKSLFDLIELSEDWYTTLANHCNKRGVDFMSAPTYLEAVKLLADVGTPAFKIASPQFDLFPEITLEAKKYNLPLIMSVGISTLGDIDRMMNLCIDEQLKDVILLHCVSQYPTPAKNANLSFISTLRNIYNCLVGYSDHTMGIHFPVTAVALGASVVEKHFTLDQKSSGPDHHFASEPEEFKHMVEQIREIHEGLGDGKKAPLTEWEIGHRERISMKFVSNKNLNAGTPICKSDFSLMRGEGGISRQNLTLIEGFSLKSDIPKDQMLEWHNLLGK